MQFSVLLGFILLLWTSTCAAARIRQNENNDAEQSPSESNSKPSRITGKRGAMRGARSSTARRAKSSSSASASSIPLLTISLTVDPLQYVPRLLRSIDYPVDEVAIQVGHRKPDVVKVLVSQIESATRKLPQLNVNISAIEYNPGSSRGFNFGLRRCVEQDKPWVLVVSSDVSFYPGTLKKIALAAHRQDPRFDIGFMSLTGHWSGVVFTQGIVEKVGYFDENIYPLVYEDVDYAVRVRLAGLKAYKIPDTGAMHGERDGNLDFASGTGRLVMNKTLTEIDADMKLLSSLIIHNMKYCREYLSSKWGFEHSEIMPRGKMEICKGVDGMNGACNPPYKHPFNDQFDRPLSYWQLDLKRLWKMFVDPEVFFI